MKHLHLKKFKTSKALRTNISMLILGITIGYVSVHAHGWVDDIFNGNSILEEFKKDYFNLASEVFKKTNLEGVEFYQSKIEKAGKEINFSIARIDTAIAPVRIISPTSLAQRVDGGVSQYSGLTIKEYATIGKYKVVHSAGFLNSWTPPSPLGYVKIDGKDYNRVHNSSISAWGFFCTNGKELIIERFKDIGQLSHWPDCIQAGALMIENGKRTMDKAKNKWPYTEEDKAQSFICIDNDKRLVMGITDRGTLEDIISVLSEPKESGGLGCINAIALSPKYTAGMVVKKRRGNNFEESGAATVPLPNAIVVE